MGNQESPVSKETPLSDSLKLAIRDEVEKRVEQRENYYWKFGRLFAALVAVFFVALWGVAVSEVRQIVEKQLAEKEVVAARNRIVAIKTAAESMDRNLNDISTSITTNQQWFMERLSQIRQQDNVVLKGDLSELFISQTATNFDGHKIVLDYEPIPHTVEIVSPGWVVMSLLMEHWGYIEGKTIIFTNNIGQPFADDFKSGAARIQYVRKSLR